MTAKAMERGIYPQEKMVEAASVYAVTGSLEKTSELAKIDLKTLKKWRKQDDFQAVLREVWSENNEKIDAKHTEIIEKSLVQVLDRIENGDFAFDKDGNLKRKPVSAKDLSLVQAINVDKRQLLRGLPTSRSDSAQEGAGAHVARLEKLAETFENLAKFGRQPRLIENGQVVDVRDESVPAAPEGHQENQVSTGEV